MEAILHEIKIKFKKHCRYIKTGANGEPWHRGAATAYSRMFKFIKKGGFGLKFTKDLPNKEGWYWIQHKSGLKAVKRVFLNHNDDLCAWVTDPYGKCDIRPIEIFKDAQWAGPVEPPPMT